MKLHDLMEQIPEPGGKSLLLQTVALFEILLAKIQVYRKFLYNKFHNDSFQAMKKEQEKLSEENASLSKSLQLKEGVEHKLTAVETNMLSVNEVVYH